MRTMLWWLGCFLLAGGAQAGSFHACDDGSGARSYQTVPCAAGQRTVATRHYEDPVATARPARGSHARVAEARSAPSRASGQAPAPGPRRTAAFACRAGAAEWVQASPCAAPASGASAERGRARSAGAAIQRPLSRTEACRQVREGALRPAPGERAARAAYRRNVLRDRAGC
jgi:hypothetical protein